MKKVIVFITVLLASLFLAKASMAAEADPIKVYSNNPHYLVYKDKPIILIGDSLTQGWFETGSNFNYRGYVDALASRGINILMIWSYIGTSASQQQSDSRIGYDAPEIWLWIGSPDQRNFDLTKLNQAYFDRLKELVAYAEAKGVIVLITVHDGWAKGRWSAHPFNSSNGGPLSSSSSYVDLSISANKNAQELFVDKLITELAPYGNVIYEMFNEGEWYDSPLRNSHEQHFLQFFNARTNKLLMTNTDHISGDDPYNDSKVDIISYHGGWTNRFSGFQNEFNRAPIKNYFLSEPVPGWNGSNVTLDDIRNSVWTTAMAGAGWVNQNDPSFGWDSNSAMASKSSLRDQAYDIAGYAARFFNNSGVNFWNMKPDGSLCSTGVCMAQDGVEYVVYASVGGTFSVSLSSGAGKSFTTRWYNPRIGVFITGSTITGGSNQSFTAPDTNDWVLHIAKSSQASNAPYPASSVIEGITWDSPSTIVRKAQGSDNWPTTWGPEDNMYISWGDGGGFGGSDAGLGVARLEGSPNNFTGTNLWSTPRGYRGGKSYGIISIDGVLYMFAGPGSDWQGSTETWLMWSNDLGRTWQNSDIFFRYTDGFSMPAFLNFGKDYAGARDNYVYVYSYDTSLGSNGPYTKINLARVLKADIKNRSAYEFFSGLDGNNNPTWTPSAANRQPVFTDPNRGVLMPSVSYNSGIKRYLLVVTHGSGSAGGWVVNTGGLGIFEAPEPWGPWSTIEYTNNWMGDTTMFFANIPNKWLSSDGLTFYLVFTGFGSGVAQDAYQHIRGVFISASPDTTPPLITSVTCSSPASVTVVFSEPVEQSSSTTIANYSINQGISILSASLGADLKTVTLTTSSHQEGITYTLTVNNIKDRAQTPNTIVSNTQKTYSYISKLIISNIAVASGKTYQAADDALQVGAATYIDRSYTFTSVPASLAGKTYIKTANEDKASAGAIFISFDINQGVTLYIAHDNRITTKPSWLASFTDTGLDLSSDDTTFSLYSKDYPAGNISLGGNEGAGGSMYSVIIIGKGATLLTGDVNQDNSVDILDVQALVNHILGIQDYGSSADVNTDGSVDVLDVQEVVNIILGR